MKSDRDSTYLSMRESETECLRREIARLRTRIADLEAQIAREQRKETRRLRSVS